MKIINALIAVSLALCSTGVFAEEGNPPTDRANKHLPLICRTGENAVAVEGLDGNIVWTCSDASVTAPEYLPSSCRTGQGIDWTCRGGNP
ncbi:hypothetical protein [Pseudomonas sp. CGJS7]|uniref:hypothetical protein n=1 Tax=Pseudomonas sp. CGJS7 TaxID=3109348 RepID=UPI0030096098